MFYEITARHLRIGDLVVRVLGNRAGIYARILAKQPKDTPHAVRVKVEVESDVEPSVSSDFRNSWSRAIAWKKVAE